MFSEFSLLKKILETTKESHRNHPALIVPPGDDAALLSLLKRPVISTDCQRENVHFKRLWQSFAEIGYKAVVVALSDLAASYASPRCLFINLGLPDSCSEHRVMELYEGVKQALALYGCALGGGNITSSQELSLDLFVVGEGECDLFPRRSNALAGEGLYVTGPLGLARAGLLCLEKGCDEFPDLIHSFKKPAARFDAAAVLLENRIACVMDISDGLSGDAGHIAEASGISISFDMAKEHVDPSLDRCCERFGLSAEEMILAGGEDYELLFTCRPDVFETMKKHLPRAFRVGTCLPFTGARLINPPKTCRSFIHGTQKG